MYSIGLFYILELSRLKEAVVAQLRKGPHIQDLLGDAPIFMDPLYKGIQTLEILLRPYIATDHQSELLSCTVSELSAFPISVP